MAALARMRELAHRCVDQREGGGREGKGEGEETVAIEIGALRAAPADCRPLNSISPFLVRARFPPHRVRALARSLASSRAGWPDCNYSEDAVPAKLYGVMVADGSSRFRRSRIN